VSATQELICDSDSGEQCVSDDSDITAADHLSEDSDNSVLTDQLWCDSRSEDRPKYIISMLSSQMGTVMLCLTSLLIPHF